MSKRNWKKMWLRRLVPLTLSTGILLGMPAAVPELMPAEWVCVSQAAAPV